MQNIDHRGVGHQGEEKNQAQDIERHVDQLHRAGMNLFEQAQDDPAAVQNGNRQEIEDCQIQAEPGAEPQQAGHIGADRSAAAHHDAEDSREVMGAATIWPRAPSNCTVMYPVCANGAIRMS